MADSKLVYAGYLKKSPPEDQIRTSRLLSSLLCTSSNAGPSHNDIYKSDSKSLNRNKNAKTRFFRLSENQVNGSSQYKFIYYKDETSKKAKGEIDLLTVSSIIKNPEKHIYDNEFMISTKHKGKPRDYHLSAKDVHEMDQWVGHLTRACKMVPENASFIEKSSLGSRSSRSNSTADGRQVFNVSRNSTTASFMSPRRPSLTHQMSIPNNSTQSNNSLRRGATMSAALPQTPSFNVNLSSSQSTRITSSHTISQQQQHHSSSSRYASTALPLSTIPASLSNSMSLVKDEYVTHDQMMMNHNNNNPQQQFNHNQSQSDNNGSEYFNLDYNNDKNLKPLQEENRNSGIRKLSNNSQYFDQTSPALSNLTANSIDKNDTYFNLSYPMPNEDDAYFVKPNDPHVSNEAHYISSDSAYSAISCAEKSHDPFLTRSSSASDLDSDMPLPKRKAKVKSTSNISSSDSSSSSSSSNSSNSSSNNVSRPSESSNSLVMESNNKDAQPNSNAIHTNTSLNYLLPTYLQLNHLDENGEENKKRNFVKNVTNDNKYGRMQSSAHYVPIDTEASKTLADLASIGMFPKRGT